ncbi:hypothetical protein L1987_22490 [Smallanthus sonchifolius]|uniref:Uncharacterized protein n=1 Tax=Smallanthus sonchifolius TaxID=185202 RepID=A0ACB9IGF9_9ASTR|nr:hypothetical protein L1987_22490 [Smallanthus sonchifolius]
MARHDKDTLLFPFPIYNSAILFPIYVPTPTSPTPDHSFHSPNISSVQFHAIRKPKSATFHRLRTINEILPLVARFPVKITAGEDPISFCLPYYANNLTEPVDVIEETNVNAECCVHVLEVLISKADTDIVEHEEELMDLLSQLVCADEVFSNMFSMFLRTKIDFLDSSIRKLKDDDENFLSTSREPAESIYDILKSLFCRYLQKKDLQLADNTSPASSSCCRVPADSHKKQTGSSSNANPMEKINRVNIISVEKQTISPIIVKVEEEDTDYPHMSPVPKYAPRTFCWGSSKKTDREVSKFQMKRPLIMKKDIVQNRTPRCNSICAKPSLETQGKWKHQLTVVKSQTYDENMSLATVPYVESSEEANAMTLATVPCVELSEEANAMSLATVPYVESHEEANANATQFFIKELDFPPGYPNTQHLQKQSLIRSKSPYSTRTYRRRKKPDSPLQTSSNSPCLALVVAKPLDGAETYNNLYTEGYYTVNDLRAIAKEQNLKGYSKFRKAELAEMLRIKIVEGRRKRPKRSETQLVPMIKCEPLL